MSRYRRKNGVDLETLDYEDAIQDIETQQRRDLGVHLYSAFLSRQVNPHFPPDQWTAWPLPSDMALDPRMTADAEDFVVGDSVYDQGNIDNTQTGKQTDPDREQPPVTLQSSGQKAALQLKSRTISSPRATLINEIHFVLQRKIKAQLARKRSQKGIITLDDDSEMMRIMATRIANKLGNVLHRLSTQKPRKLQNKPGSSKRYLKNWQDVALADLCNDKLGQRVNIEAHRRKYLKMRDLFVNASYDYRYDADMYADLEGGEQTPVPEFNVDENLDAIEQEGLTPDGLERAQEIMQRRQKDVKFKERLYLSLLYQAVRMKQLSWDPHDISEKPYTPQGEFLQERRERIFQHVSLNAEDFEAMPPPR
ncbi:hypothetical protein OXX59_004246 [Metschnikowia pulcherrima]